MNNNEFYDVIDNEIQQIVDVNKDNPELQKKNLGVKNLNRIRRKQND